MAEMRSQSDRRGKSGAAGNESAGSKIGGLRHGVSLCAEKD